MRLGSSRRPYWTLLLLRRLARSTRPRTSPRGPAWSGGPRTGLARRKSTRPGYSADMRPSGRRASRRTSSCGCGLCARGGRGGEEQEEERERGQLTARPLGERTRGRTGEAALLGATLARPWQLWRRHGRVWWSTNLVVLVLLRASPSLHTSAVHRARACARCCCLCLDRPAPPARSRLGLPSPHAPRADSAAVACLDSGPPLALLGERALQQQRDRCSCVRTAALVAAERDQGLRPTSACRAPHLCRPARPHRLGLTSLLHLYLRQPRTAPAAMLYPPVPPPAPLAGPSAPPDSDLNPALDDGDEHVDHHHGTSRSSSSAPTINGDKPPARVDPEKAAAQFEVRSTLAPPRSPPASDADIALARAGPSPLLIPTLLVTRRRPGEAGPVVVVVRPPVVPARRGERGRRRGPQAQGARRRMDRPSSRRQRWSEGASLPFSSRSPAQTL